MPSAWNINRPRLNGTALQLALLIYRESGHSLNNEICMENEDKEIQNGAPNCF